MHFTRGLSILAGVLAFGALAPRTASAQQSDVEARVTVQPDSVRVGDPFRILVNVRAPLGATIEFPASLDSSGTVQSIDPRALFPQADSTGVNQTAVYRVAAWDVGRQPIHLPDIIVHVGGQTRTIPIVGRAVFVVSVLPEDTTLRVPKPARALFEHSFIPWWFWAAIVGGILAIVVAWWLIRRRRRRRPVVAIVVDPYTRAQRDFERIESLGLVDAGERSRHVALVVDVLREYVAQRFADAPLSLTATELLSATQPINTLPHDRLMRILNEADLVKFARRPVSADRAQDIGREARELVEHEHVASTPAATDDQEAAA